MINAKQARKEALSNFLKHLTDDEKTAHFYVEAKIKEQVELGYMYLYLNYQDMPDLFDLITTQFGYDKLRYHYSALGYNVRANTDKQLGGLRVSW